MIWSFKKQTNKRSPCRPFLILSYLCVLLLAIGRGSEQQFVAAGWFFTCFLKEWSQICPSSMLEVVLIFHINKWVRFIGLLLKSHDFSPPEISVLPQFVTYKELFLFFLWNFVPSISWTTCGAQTWTSVWLSWYKSCLNALNCVKTLWWLVLKQGCLRQSLAITNPFHSVFCWAYEKPK